ncbi:WD40 repeat-like protein [Sistotremastrum suecicum HHB10207 ss-3]|uniref:WD40 repeat-like protein n=1 Tax=Sistotremastrum suecicum HHB10207 ss-3 TaxID=1314776 RepID=A0A165Z0T4_9AGAM|nr:WD40 repeat-like protein [Sistotremastrum suecicum HHB10207 ss-3]
MSYNCVQSIRYDGRQIRCISISPCGSLLACGSDDGVRIWDDFEDDPIVILLECPAQTILWISSDDGAWVLICGLENGCFVTLDYDHGDLNSFETEAHSTSVVALELSDEDNLLASGSEGDGCVVWARTGHISREVASSVEKAGIVHAPGFLLTAFADGSLLCFSLQTKSVAWGTNLGTPIALPGLLVNQHEWLFIGAASGAVHVWDVTHGTPVAELNHDGHLPPYTRIRGGYCQPKDSAKDKHTEPLEHQPLLFIPLAISHIPDLADCDRIVSSCDVEGALPLRLVMPDRGRAHEIA